MNLSEIASQIETLRQQLVQMYLEGKSLTSEAIVSLSQELDNLLNEFERRG